MERNWTPEPWGVEDHGAMAVSIISTTRDPDKHWNGRHHYVGSLFYAPDMHRAVACVNACAGLDDPAKEIDALREALAAAEAECAEWREKAGLPPSPEDKLGWGTDSERNWEALIPAADANDATRARLGLGRIGEVGK